MSKTDAIYQWVGEQSKAAAQSWFEQQCQDPFAALHLYYRQGELRVCQDCPEGFELADGKRLMPSSTLEQVQAEIYRKARFLPVLPKELCI